MKLTAVYQKVPEGYVAFVEELRGANALGETLDEARDSLAKAVELVLGANRQLSELSLKGNDVIREPLVVN
jgi:predicted RNase H-like HicB family nuclease